MIRLVRVLIWLRWRLLMRALAGRGRRDSLEEASRALAGLLPLALKVLLVPSALGLAFLGFLFGQNLGRTGTIYIGAPIVVGRIALLAAGLAVLLAPVIRAGRAGEPGTTRLLLLPIHRRWLHLSDVLAGLGDPWMALLVAGVATIPLGLFATGAWLAGLFAVVGGAGLLLAMAALASGLSSGLALLLRRRRRAEWISLVAMTLLSITGLLLAAVLEEPWLLPREPPGTGPARRPPAFEPPDWWDLLPSELFVAAIGDGLDGRLAAGLRPCGGVLLWAGALLVASAWAHRRLLETPEVSGGGSRRTRPAARAPELPGLSRGASAVAITALRVALRTVRGKLGVYLNVLMLGVMSLVLARRTGEFLTAERMGVSMGLVVALAGYLFSLLSLQPILLNQFAVDRSGLAALLLSPLSTREIVRGKLVAGSLLVGSSTLLCAVVAGALVPRGDPLLWLTLLPLCAGSYALVGPTALLLSLVLPKTADLSRMGRAGNAHPLATVLGLLLIPLAIAPGLALAVGAVAYTRSSAIALLFVTIWLCVAALLGYPVLLLAERLLVRRRENLLLVAGGR